MKIAFISDTHCMLNKVEIPEVDILVHCGDALSKGSYGEWSTFLKRLVKTEVEHIIYVPGNHDIITELNEDLIKEECKKFRINYLNDSGVTIEGIKFWGSAVTPRFRDWAWNRDLEKDKASREGYYEKFDPIQKHWDLIPEDIDVLITHGPPYGIKDVSIYDGANCGCPQLLEKVKEIKPKIHSFGHIHNWYGKVEVGGITFINASTCDENYDPVNKPIIMELESE